MRFSRLRVSGFKSFVDPTELHIERGLTGVVGPNGCGKSNILEAIRWVMGENSAKSLRGSGMDDVIFSGTDKRPPRRMAEVTLVIDNIDRTAPVDFNDEDTIEITRRIERESGSSYRINGRDVRQKDVQLLFADAATGAHSPALVSQGRIGSLIAAKPQGRRQLLEEAAGVSGLHARRKEAESRLRSAEANLVRVQDVVQAMDQQVQGLKRQARQAVRYRTISADIRIAEACLLYVRWKDSSEKVITLEQKMRGAGGDVAAISSQLTVLSQAQAVGAALLPPLRTEDAAAAARMQRLSIEEENLETEAERRKQSAISLRQALVQLRVDRTREQEITADAKAALDRLSTEKHQLEKEKDAERAAETEASEALEAVSSATQNADILFDTLNGQAAETRAHRSSLERDTQAINRRIEQLLAEKVRLDRDSAVMSGFGDVEAPVQAAIAQVTGAEAALSEVGAAVKASEAATVEARRARGKVDSEHAELTGRARALSGEIASFKALLERKAGEDEPVANDLAAAEGYEIAAGAAFGDDIDAGLDAEASRFWRADAVEECGALEAAPAWPEGIVPLGQHVAVPDVLERRLAFTGFAATFAAGDQAAARLLPGQSVADATGNYWRWDGFVQRAGAPNKAAIRLEHKNRLRGLETQRAALAATIAEAEDAFAVVEAVHKQARGEEQLQRTLRQTAEKGLAEFRRALSKAEQDASKHTARSAMLQEAWSRLKEELSAATNRKVVAVEQLEALPDADIVELALKEQRVKVEAVRHTLGAARATYDGLYREAVARNERLELIMRDHLSWVQRIASAEKQLKALEEREMASQRQLEAAEASPAALEKRKRILLDQLEVAEMARRVTSDKLVVAEGALHTKEQELKTVQQQVSNIREQQIRAEAAVESAENLRSAIADQIRERFECAPTQLLDKAGLDTSESLPALTVIEIRLEKFKRERDRMGAVNLRADEELAEITEQMDHLNGERADLAEAIARLRQAIHGLNKEGRDRLLAAFDVVNVKFGELFTTLFGGGAAHLELTESDDPLEAGLEIFASPPGKKLQVLSLLSGGEQALTALSLIFAVFITNPAPLCVLDEVDAPLDDANVERFCNLLDTMTERTNTRFLIVTHNAVSMARMNRLFGVTMAERGISTLVSVDLERAEGLMEAG